MDAGMIASVNDFRNNTLNSARAAFNTSFAADQAASRAASDSARAAARAEKSVGRPRQPACHRAPKCL